MSEKQLQQYYKSYRRYFLKLQEKEFRAWFSKYYRFLKVGEKKGLVLDVGCGVGQVVAKLAEGGLQPVGIDVSPIAIKIASESTKKHPNAVFVVASGYTLPFREEIFDKAGCFDLLEHLSDPATCLNEMLRVVNTEGNIVVASPNLLCPVYGKGFKKKLSNTLRLLAKMIKRDKKLSFPHIEPKLDWSGKEVGRDADAITIVDPFTIEEIFRESKVRVQYRSSYLGTNRILERLSTLPFFRNVGGGIFVVGMKAVGE